jgi:hypothetical protein
MSDIVLKGLALGDDYRALVPEHRPATLTATFILPSLEAAPVRAACAAARAAADERVRQEVQKWGDGELKKARHLREQLAQATAAEAKVAAELDAARLALKDAIAEDDAKRRGEAEKSIAAMAPAVAALAERVKITEALAVAEEERVRELCERIAEAVLAQFVKAARDRMAAAKAALLRAVEGVLPELLVSEAAWDILDGQSGLTKVFDAETRRRRAASWAGLGAPPAATPAPATTANP